MSTVAVFVTAWTEGQTSVEDLERDARLALRNHPKVKDEGLVVGDVRYAGIDADNPLSVDGWMTHRFTADIPDA